MKKQIIIFLVFLFSSTFIFSQTSVNLGLSINTGYNGGIGARTQFMIYNLTKEIPFHLRFGIGYTSFNPGISTDARRIFINNATNGTPEKNGHNFDFRMDFLIPVKFLNNSYVNVGPRYSNFTGNFKFIGGNEDFDIVSKQWGVGLGGGNYFKIAENFDFEISLGADYFFSSALTGHDTSYSPDNDNINSRTDNENDNIEFTYKDADKAVNQPKIMPQIMIGLVYKL